MSQLADINDIFSSAISAGIASEEELLTLKLEIFDTLNWDSAADKLHTEMIDKGHSIPAYNTRSKQ